STKGGCFLASCSLFTFWLYLVGTD
ncbi:hypothetical protein CISIN_1g0327842mg, partial [Citrus sinensis]